MKIRLAEMTDIPFLVEIGAAFVQESPTYKKRGYVPERAAQHFEWLINGGGIIFLAEKHGNIVGGFAGGVTTDWQSDHKLAFDYVMYVHPRHRSSSVGRSLVESFIDWAKSMGATRINCGTATMINTEHCASLYESLGFEKVGLFLEKEL